MRSFLLRLFGRMHRPPDYSFLDNLNDHMLRDIGFEPDGRKDASSVGFWRRR